ncbi:MAG: PAS domain-containing protein [Chthoniobacteraceae bacterium]
MNLNVTPSPGSEFHRSILDAMPFPVLVLEESYRIVDTNSAANQVIGMPAEEARMHRPGEVLRCIHAAETSVGCGGTPFCRSCSIRTAIGKAFQGEYPPRQVVKLLVSGDEQMLEMQYLMTVAPLNFENLRLVLMILEDVREISSQMLPICSNCKQVRSEDDYWQSVESYLSSRLEIHCTHSLCPECAQKFFPEYAQALQIHTEGSTPPAPEDAP